MCETRHSYNLGQIHAQGSHPPRAECPEVVPVSKHLPLAKIKEVMFTFILEVLNAPGSLPGFFNARKATKPRTRSHKRNSGEKQPADDMAVDAPLSDLSPPPLSTRNPLGSTPASDAGARNEGDKGEVSPGPSLEAPGTRGVADVLLTHLTLLFSQTRTLPGRLEVAQHIGHASWQRTLPYCRPHPPELRPLPP